MTSWAACVAVLGGNPAVLPAQRACPPCRRALLVPAQRVLLLASPSIRQTGVGTSLLLEREPQEGLRGVVRQLLAVASGKDRQSCCCSLPAGCCCCQAARKSCAVAATLLNQGIASCIPSCCPAGVHLRHRHTELLWRRRVHALIILRALASFWCHAVGPLVGRHSAAELHRTKRG